MANTFPELKDDYAALWHRMAIRSERVVEARHIVSKMISPTNKTRYQSVAAATNVPWFVIALIHNMEASLRFNTHLHNGDPLTARTVNVPPGRPANGSPPFTWEESAKDAIEQDGLSGISPWTVERIAFQLEKFNGFGCRNHHPHVKTPYLWSFSNIYTAGKYVADRSWSETAVSQQCGAMILLRLMIEQGAVVIPTEGAVPPPDDAPAPSDSPRFPNRYLRNGLENDRDVGRVQRRLIDLRIFPGPLDDDFGDLTEQAIRLFQARSCDETGAPLEIDGIVGPKTWGALFAPGTSTDPNVPPPPPPSNLKDAVLDIAADEVGIREDPLGSNRGPRVDEYIRATGLNPEDDHYPWCMCFVFWCFNQAANKIGAVSRVPKNASVHGAWNKSQTVQGATMIPAAAAQRDPSLVKPGMVFFINTGGSRGHTGIVTANINGLLETIEGNTNDGGSREGIGVFRRTRRRITDINLGFGDYG